MHEYTDSAHTHTHRHTHTHTHTNIHTCHYCTYTLLESNERAKLEEWSGRRSQDFWSVFQRGDTLRACCFREWRRPLLRQRQSAYPGSRVASKMIRYTIIIISTQFMSDTTGKHQYSVPSTCLHIYLHTHTHTHTHTDIHTHVFTVYIHVYTHTHTHTHWQSYTCLYCLHTCVHTHTHTDNHTHVFTVYIHVYTHKHTHR